MENRLEALARKIAAKKMGLVKDPEGSNLPDDLWQQALPEARDALAIQEPASAPSCWGAKSVAFIVHDPEGGDYLSWSPTADMGHGHTPLAPASQVCIACGKPWDGEKCGQQDNGWPHAVCEPAPAAPSFCGWEEAAKIAEAVIEDVRKRSGMYGDEYASVGNRILKTIRARAQPCQCGEGLGKAKAILWEMQSLSFGVSGQPQKAVSDYFNRRTDDALAALARAEPCQCGELRKALHRISLGSQDSGTTKEGLGREARNALAATAPRSGESHE